MAIVIASVYAITALICVIEVLYVKAKYRRIAQIAASAQHASLNLDIYFPNRLSSAHSPFSLVVIVGMR